MAEDFIDRIAEKLPIKQIYNDAIGPAAKEAGAIGEDLIKTLRLALVPFQFTAAFQDRVAHFIDKSVRAVPEDRRVAPPPQIIGPVLEGIRYEPEDTPIDEMFSALLSNSMDQARFDTAHPSFPILIRQLSRDEAVILKELASRNFSTVEKLDKNLERRSDDEPYWVNRVIEKQLDFPFDKLLIPHKFDFYSNHMFNLGLACYSKTRGQEVIRDASGKQIGTRKFQDFHLMPLGRALVEACTRDAAQASE